MSAQDLLSLPLPVLRPDLEFYRGQAETDGSPTWTVHDPLTGVYRKFGWAESLILQHLRGRQTFGSLLQKLTRFTTLALEPGEILRFCEEAEREHLTVASAVGQTASLRAQAEAGRVHPLKWILLHYLYIRIPLLHPDRFLTRTLPAVRWLASRTAFAVYVTVFMAGLFLLLQHWAAYLRTFPYFFSIEGACLYGLALILLKAIHEFSHAYTAKALGVRVPTMGIAFMVLCPVAFCEVTDSWKLPRRSQRFRISAAGICAELVIAGIALFLWGITSPGPLQSTFFVLSSATLLSTLLVNLNPAMRFDGYYILGDLWGIDNLRERSFAFTRWALRKWFLGLTIASPEAGLPRRHALGLILYALYACAYRIVLYLGIAVLVYYKFTKVLGAVLFAFEIYWFLWRPLAMEAQALIRLRQQLHLNARLVATLALLGSLVLWVALPLRRPLAIPAVVVAEASQTLYAPADGTVASLHLARGLEVHAGDEMLTLHSEDLDASTAILELEIKNLDHEFLRLRVDEKARSLLTQKQEEIQQARARLLALRERAHRNVIRSEIDGVVYACDEALRPGIPLARGTVLGRIVRPDARALTAFLPEDHLQGLQPGMTVRFLGRDARSPIPCTVKDILPLREETAPREALTSLRHSDLPMVETADGRISLVGSFYEVRLELPAGPSGLRPGQTGHVWMKTTPRSRLLDALRYAWRVLVRESGF